MNISPPLPPNNLNLQTFNNNLLLNIAYCFNSYKEIWNLNTQVWLTIVLLQQADQHLQIP